VTLIYKSVRLCDLCISCLIIIIRKLGRLSSRLVINHLKGIFDEHGIPERFIWDNGTHYSSQEFKQFAATYGFEHVTSLWLYARSNGFAERMVQTVKHLFTKARESVQDPHMGILCLRTTPIHHHLPSPCELLSGRKYHSNVLNTTSSNLGESPANYISRLQHRQNLQKVFHDRNAKDLPPLHGWLSSFLTAHQHSKGHIVPRK